jgi:hypothetical protein
VAALVGYSPVEGDRFALSFGGLAVGRDLMIDIPVMLTVDTAVAWCIAQRDLSVEGAWSSAEYPERAVDPDAWEREHQHSDAQQTQSVQAAGKEVRVSCGLVAA